MRTNTNLIYTNTLAEKQAAIQKHIAMGMDVFPLPPQSKGKGLDSGWAQRAISGHSLDEFTIDRNTGVLLGGKENISDADCDDPFAIRVAGDVLPDEFPGTIAFGRPSKRYAHYLYACDESLPSKQFRDPITGKMLIEFRCLSAQGERTCLTVCPPSTHESGEPIAFEPDAPSVLARVSANKLRDVMRLIAAISLLAKYFPSESRRHDCILALAGALARGRISREAALCIIGLAYRHSKGFGGDSGKVQADVKDVYRTFTQSPDTHLYGYPTLTETMPPEVVDKALEWLNVAPPGGSSVKPQYALNDEGNGLRFVAKYGDHVRYCSDVKTWFVWTGTHWAADSAQHVRELAKTISHDLRSEAEALTSPDASDKGACREFTRKQQSYFRFAAQSGNSRNVAAILTSAESDPRIRCSRSDFDGKEYDHLLNAKNGVVNLRTGDLLPHDPGLLITQICPTRYVPGARHQIWKASLSAFTRKHAEDLPGWLQMGMGYSIQGNKVAERLFLVYGIAQSGKGTFFYWCSSTLGSDYVRIMSPDSLLRQHRNASGPSSDLARLEGARLVIVSEFERGNKLQEAFLKSASGGDSFVARTLHKGEREIRPTMQFWFQSNYRLGFDSQDSGNLRRYLEVPFDNALGKDPLVTFDPGLKSRMSTDDSFREAVLAWMVEGAVRFHRDGFYVCPTVEKSTKALFAENDFLSQFFEDCVDRSPRAFVPVRTVRQTFENWCAEQGREPVRGSTFIHMLEERGFRSKQTWVSGKNIRCWQGMQIKLPYLQGEGEAVRFQASFTEPNLAPFFNEVQ